MNLGLYISDPGAQEKMDRLKLHFFWKRVQCVRPQERDDVFAAGKKRLNRVLPSMSYPLSYSVHGIGQMVPITFLQGNYASYKMCQVALL